MSAVSPRPNGLPAPPAPIRVDTDVLIFDLTKSLLAHIDRHISRLEASHEYTLMRHDLHNLNIRRDDVVTMIANYLFFELEMDDSAPVVEPWFGLTKALQCWYSRVGWEVRTGSTGVVFRAPLGA